MTRRGIALLWVELSEAIPTSWFLNPLVVGDVECDRSVLQFTDVRGSIPYLQGCRCLSC